MCRTNFESYLSPNTNHFMQQGDAWCDKLGEGIFKFGAHTAGLGREIAHLRGDTGTAGKLNSLASGFDAGRSAISAIRVIFPIHKLFSGKMFWAAKKKKESEAGPEAHANVKYVVRDWMDITMDILVLAARILSPIQALHRLKVIDLGHHAKRMFGASMGLWGAVVAMNMVQVTRDLVKETDVKLIKKRAWDGIQSGIDLIALPFDFGLGASHPALAITGAAINMIAAGGMLAREALA